MPLQEIFENQRAKSAPVVASGRQRVKHARGDWGHVPPGEFRKSN